MKPFATLGSEIGKVRDHLLREVRPLSDDLREQRERLLTKLGEQTFRLVAERRLVVPPDLRETAERLATLLGVRIPGPMLREEVESGEVDEPSLGDLRDSGVSPPPLPEVERPPAGKAHPNKSATKGRLNKKTGRKPPSRG